MEIFETIMIYLIAITLGIYLFNIKPVKKLRKLCNEHEDIIILITAPLVLWFLGMCFVGFFYCRY